MRLRVFFLAAVAMAALPQMAMASSGTTATFQNFGPNLSGQCPNPEGIATDPQGNVYAASLPLFVPHTSANICVVSPAGVVIDTITIQPAHGVANLIGELFEPGQGLYVLDFADAATGATGDGRLLLVDPASHAVSTVATGFTGPNALVQDRHRNLFVSDSFLGGVWKVAPDGASTLWVQSSLLVPNGNPPFGANGLAFDRNERNLYVANTSTDSIIRVPVLPDGSAGSPTVFAHGVQGTGVLDGADGIMFDVQGNLWVCANQANEVQVLSASGQLIARYVGSGANALDFPASLVFKGRQLYVTNLALTNPSDSRLSVMTAPLPGRPLHP